MTDKELERKELIEALKDSYNRLVSELSYKINHELSWQDCDAISYNDNVIEERYEFLARDIVYCIENCRYKLDELNK
jgi:hypothetical protein